jgi:hypothetical protein
MTHRILNGYMLPGVHRSVFGSEYCINIAMRGTRHDCCGGGYTGSRQIYTGKFIKKRIRSSRKAANHLNDICGKKEFYT